MTLTDYQTEAKKTAMYPQNQNYPILGLINEIGEFVEKHCDDIDEAGDILWYIANIASDYGIELTDAEYDAVNVEHIDYDELGGMIVYTGEIAGMLKKFIRDQKPIDLERLKICLYGIIASLSDFCDINKAMGRNVEKLRDRMNRGVIKGDGDKR